MGGREREIMQQQKPLHNDCIPRTHTSITRLNRHRTAPHTVVCQSVPLEKRWGKKKKKKEEEEEEEEKKKGEDEWEVSSRLRK